MTAEKPRILVIKLSSLGDLFHVLPSVQSIQAGLKGTVHWVTQPEYVSLVQCFEGVDRVIAFPRRDFVRSFPGFWREVRAEGYDLVLDFQGLFKSGMVSGIARGRRKIGPSFWREGARLFYQEVAGARNIGRHAVDQALDFCRHLGLRVEPVHSRVRFPDMESQVPAGRPRVAMVPVSRWESKNWPESRYADLGRMLVREREAKIVLLGGAADGAVCARVAAAIGSSCVNLAGQLRLPETGGVLSRMDLVVANDSGPVHMAAACGTPTLVLFGPTDPVRTGPYGPGHRVIRVPVPCQPCYRRVCGERGKECLTRITAAQVFGVASHMLAARVAGNY